MRVETQPPSASAALLQRAVVDGDLLFEDADEPGAWQALLPGMHWRRDEYATLSRGEASALALVWAVLEQDARDLTYGCHVLSVAAIARILAVARVALSTGCGPATMQWSQYVATVARLRPQLAAAQAAECSLVAADFEPVVPAAGGAAVPNGVLLLEHIHHDSILGGDASAASMARLEVFCHPRRAPGARAAGGAEARAGQVLLDHAMLRSGGAHTAVPLDEAAEIAAAVWRECQWEECLLILPKAGSPRVAELRLQLGTAPEEAARATVLRGRLRQAMDSVPAIAKIAVNEHGALRGSEVTVYNELLRLLEGVETDESRRTRGVAHLGPRELGRLEALMSPLLPVLETDEYKRMGVADIVASLCSSAERMRTKFSSHVGSSASVQGAGGATSEPAAAKVAVPAVYKDALNVELHSQRYMVVKELLLVCHRDAGEFVAETVLDMAVTGEHADGETHRSPLLLQIAWGTFQADAVDAEIAFLSEYADQAWPTALARAVCEHLSAGLDEVPIACKGMAFPELYAQLKAHDWSDLNIRHAYATARAAKNHDPKPAKNAVGQFTDSAASLTAASDMRALMGVIDDVLAFAGFDRTEPHRSSDLLSRAANVLELHGKSHDKELVREVCVVLRTGLRKLGEASHRARTSKNPTRELPAAGVLLQAERARLAVIDAECVTASNQATYLKRMGWTHSSDAASGSGGAGSTTGGNSSPSGKLTTRRQHGPGDSAARRLSFASSGAEVAVDGKPTYSASGIRRACGRGCCPLAIVAHARGFDPAVECEAQGAAHTQQAHAWRGPASFRLRDFKLDLLAKRAREWEVQWPDDTHDDGGVTHADGDGAPEDDLDGDAAGSRDNASERAADDDDADEENTGAGPTAPSQTNRRPGGGGGRGGGAGGTAGGRSSGQQGRGRGGGKGQSGGKGKGKGKGKGGPRGRGKGRPLCPVIHGARYEFPLPKRPRRAPPDEPIAPRTPATAPSGTDCAAGGRPAASLADALLESLAPLVARGCAGAPPSRPSEPEDSHAAPAARDAGSRAASARARAASIAAIGETAHAADAAARDTRDERVTTEAGQSHPVSSGNTVPRSEAASDAHGPPAQRPAPAARVPSQTPLVWARALLTAAAATTGHHCRHPAHVAHAFASAGTPSWRLCGASGTPIAIIPVAVCRGGYACLLPRGRGPRVFGTKCDGDPKRGGARTDAATKVAQSIIDATLCGRGSGVYAFYGGLVSMGGADVDVVVAPVATRGHEWTQVAATPAAFYSNVRSAAPSGATWCSLKAIPSRRAEYRICAAAVLRVESMLRPTAVSADDAPHGAVAAALVESDLESEARRARVARERRAVTIETERLCAALIAHAKDDAYLRSPFLAWVDRLRASPAAEVPDDLHDCMLEPAARELASMPFAHRCPIHSTEPLPEPAAVVAPTAALPFSWREALMPWALQEVDRAFSLRADYHRLRRSGLSCTRPPDLALGCNAVRGPWRHVKLDFRAGPGRTSLLAEAGLAVPTHLHLDAWAAYFQHYPHRRLVQMGRDGVVFQDTLPPQIVITSNLHSLYDNVDGIDAVANEMHELRVERGWYSACAEDLQLPTWPCRIMPRGTVPRASGGPPRGLSEQGAPRNELRCLRSDEPVEAVNVSAGPVRHQPGDSSPKWFTEVKPRLSDAARNAAILAHVARILRVAVLVIAFDFKYFFHQLAYRLSEVWKMGFIVPKRSAQAGASDDLVVLLELVMAMGCSPSSNIAQDLANAICWKFLRGVDEREAPRLRRLESQCPAFAEWLRERRAMPHDDYGTQARLHDALMYTDDSEFMVVGADAALNALIVFHRFIGPAWRGSPSESGMAAAIAYSVATQAGAVPPPSALPNAARVGGLNLMPAKPAKWHAGGHVVWVGGGISPHLGVVWVPAAKALRAVRDARLAMSGDMTAGHYRSFVHFLQSLVFMVGGEKYRMRGLFRPTREDQELGRGPDTKVVCDAEMLPRLRLWVATLLNRPGCSILKSVHKVPKAAFGRSWVMRGDAALEGEGEPGMARYLYGFWWRVPLDSDLRLRALPIAVLEFLTAAVNIVVFGPVLDEAARVIVETDALSTALVLVATAHAPDIAAAHEVLQASDEYLRLTRPKRRLSAQHTYGAANPLPDAISRNKMSVFREMCAALGVKPEEVGLSERGKSYLENALAAIMASRRLAARSSTPDDGSDAAAAAAVQRGVGFASNDSGDGPPPPSAAPDRLGPRIRHRAPPGLSPRAGVDTSKLSSRWTARSRKEGPPRDGGIPAPPGRDAMWTPRIWGALRSISDAQLNAPPRGGAPGRQSEGAHTSRLRPPPGVASGGAEAAATRKRHTADPTAYRAVFGTASLAASGTGTQRSTAEIEAMYALSHARVALAKRQAAVPRSGNLSGFLQAAYNEKIAATIKAIRADTSALALRPADEALLSALLTVAAKTTMARTPANTAKLDSSYWRMWVEWCTAMGTSPLRTNTAANRGLESTAATIELSLRLGAFMLWVVSNPKLQPDSMLARLRGVARVHKALGYDFGPLSQVAEACKGATQEYILEYGPEALIPKRKEPLTSAMLRTVMVLPYGLRIGAVVVGKSAEWQGIRAFNCLMSKGGFRKADVALDSGIAFSKRHMSLQNVRWHIGGRWVERPTESMRNTYTLNDRVHVIPPPSKADPDGSKWAASQVVSRWNPQDPLNLFIELSEYECMRAVDGDDRRLAPLLLAPNGRAWRKQALDEFFHSLMVVVVGREQASRYSVHSYRIYLACALRAAGASKEMIMEMLRWSSEDALKLYARINSNDDAAWREAAVSARIDSIRSGTILRQPVVAGDSDEARIQLLERANGADISGVDRSEIPRVDIDDAVSKLHDSEAALEAAARRHDERVRAATVAEFDDLRGEIAEEE